MDRVLSQSLTAEEGEMAEAELQELEADYDRLEAAEELPSVPKVRLSGAVRSTCCRIPSLSREGELCFKPM